MSNLHTQNAVTQRTGCSVPLECLVIFLVDMMTIYVYILGALILNINKRRENGIS